MATSVWFAQSFPRSVWPIGCVFLALGCYLSVASPTTHGGRRLICWQAIMNCQTEPECHYSYGQYMHACGPVLNGQRKKCPSHCIASLVQLNLTKNGPALEECSCAQDPMCMNTKKSIEPCLPRTSNTGCTEARRQCERDQQCSYAMQEYLVHCGKLFSGATCTNACRNVIANMRKIPKALLLDTCVCDGTERAICEFVKSSMQTLCFEAPVQAEDGSGLDDYEDEDDDEDFPKEPEYVSRVHKTHSTAHCLAARGVVTLLASIWALLPLL
ncbi:hypothetical protein NHX12_028471 [Muraenolepis orangiensis]|uniref:GDNF/GAS1 domain-containing protein n=1 Tax=Muraenolepis orangiensis TaxID=630683 RepID=A0A9Q0IMJ7_9TELE|nr:hypothetical protein NHX12_028471 [Muraenolepis orangiensis]